MKRLPAVFAAHRMGRIAVATVVLALTGFIGVSAPPGQPLAAAAMYQLHGQAVFAAHLPGVVYTVTPRGQAAHCAAGKPYVHCTLFDDPRYIAIRGSHLKDGRYFYAVLTRGSENCLKDSCRTNLSGPISSYRKRIVAVHHGTLPPTHIRPFRARPRASTGIRSFSVDVLALARYDLALCLLGPRGSPATEKPSNCKVTTFSDEPKVTLCHATGSGSYVQETVAASGAYDGHYLEHPDDIIPPFEYNGQTYSTNWDPEHQAIWNNGCNPVPTPTATPRPTATNTPVPTNTSPPGPEVTAQPTPTLTPTEPPTPTATTTPVPTDTPIVTSTPSPTDTPVSTPTNTPVPTPTNTSTPVPTNTSPAGPVVTAQPTPSPTATNTPVPPPTDTPVPTPTATPTATATPGPGTPTATPTTVTGPTATATKQPTATATSTETTTLTFGTLTIDKQVYNATLHPGGGLQYESTAVAASPGQTVVFVFGIQTGSGPYAARDMVLTDMLSGFRAAGCSSDPCLVRINVGNPTPGAVTTVTLSAIVTDIGALPNRASVAGSNTGTAYSNTAVVQSK